MQNQNWWGWASIKILTPLPKLSMRNTIQRSTSSNSRDFDMMLWTQTSKLLWSSNIPLARCKRIWINKHLGEFHTFQDFEIHRYIFTTPLLHTLYVFSCASHAFTTCKAVQQGKAKEQGESKRTLKGISNQRLNN